MASSCRAMVMAALLLGFMAAGVVACDRCVYQGKASYSAPSVKDVDVGQCMFGDFPGTVSKGALATVSYKIHGDIPVICDCYLVRCKDKRRCSRGGVKVLVTGFTDNSQTDFVLAPESFKRMALTGNATQLPTEKGFIDVEYIRIPCESPAMNMNVRIDKNGFPTRSTIPAFRSRKSLRKAAPRAHLRMTGITTEQRN